MGHRPNCRSCRHCSPPSGEQLGTCHLRQLPIHAELASELWCHHWMARAPRLPITGASVRAGARCNQQLSFGPDLAGSNGAADIGRHEI
jgi:hypothetical protein